VSVSILVKNSAKEKILLDVIRAYEQIYPTKFAFFSRALAELRKVTKESSIDAKGRELRMEMRVPSELFLFLQSIMPDFGKDSDDIALLLRTWGDFARATKDRRRRTLFWSDKDAAPCSSSIAAPNSAPPSPSPSP
jgi:hypothetical protein